MSEPERPPHPSDPSDEGVETQSPEAMQLEAGRLLANEARATLRDQGFGDDQIERWAQTYVARFGAGDAQDLIDWVATEQHR